MADKKKALEALHQIPDDLLIDPKRDTTLKYIENPDPMIARLRESGRAAAQGIPPACPHPLSAIGQYVDRGTNTPTGRQDRPTNLFQCDLCNNLLSLTDFWGRPASDG